MKPPWTGYPSRLHGPGPIVSGTDSFSLGALMGELKMGQAQIIGSIQQQTEVLRAIHILLLSNASLMAERMTEPPPQKPMPEPLPQKPETGGKAPAWLHWIQIGIAVAVVAGALLGKISLKDALPLIGKPFGF